MLPNNSHGNGKTFIKYLCELARQTGTENQVCINLRFQTSSAIFKGHANKYLSWLSSIINYLPLKISPDFFPNLNLTSEVGCTVAAPK